MIYCDTCRTSTHDYSYCNSCKKVTCLYCDMYCYLCENAYCNSCIMYCDIFPYDDEYSNYNVCICKLCNYAICALKYLHKISKYHFKLKRVKLLTYDHRPKLLKIVFIL